MHIAVSLVLLSFASSLHLASAVSARGTPLSSACQELLKAHSLSSVKPALKSAGVIPDVLPKSFKPSVLLEAVFANTTKTVLGETIPLNITINEPKIRGCPLGKHEVQKTYTLIMVDPDAPSRATPTYRDARHWLVTGARLSTYRKHSPYIIETDQPVTPYLNPQPGAGSGKHRYVIVLLEEPSPNFSIPQGAPEYNATIPGRLNWNVANFTKVYNLQPVGAAFFETEAT